MKDTPHSHLCSSCQHSWRCGQADCSPDSARDCDLCLAQQHFTAKPQGRVSRDEMRFMAHFDLRSRYELYEFLKAREAEFLDNWIEDQDFLIVEDELDSYREDVELLEGDIRSWGDGEIETELKSLRVRLCQERHDDIERPYVLEKYEIATRELGRRQGLRELHSHPTSTADSQEGEQLGLILKMIAEVMCSTEAVKLAEAGLLRLTEWMEQNVVTRDILPPRWPEGLPPILQQLSEQVAGARGHLVSARELWDGVLSKFGRGLKLDRDEFYLVRAEGLWVPSNSEYEEFMMHHYEDDERKGYINARQAPVQPGTIGPRWGVTPEDVRVAYLTDEQKRFFRERLPHSWKRFRH